MGRIDNALEKAAEIRETDHNKIMDKRKDKRYCRKLMVRISSGKLLRSGIMSDVSKNGMFVMSGRDFTKDMVIGIALSLPNNKISFIVGIVTRDIGIPGSNWLMGKGIELIKKDEPFRNFLKTLT